MAEFLSVARRLWQTGKVREYDEAFKTVFDAMAELQAVHSKSTLDFNNVESLFSAVELAKTIGKFPNRTVQQIDGILDALKIVIVATLEKTILFPSLDRGSFSAPRPYSEFVSLVRELRETARPPHRTGILTFNYDVCVDVALYFEGLDAHYGLDGTSGDGAAIPLLKLHGSLNWTDIQKTREIVPWLIQDYLSRHSIGPFGYKNILIPIGTHLSELKAQHSDATGLPVLVAPTFNKGDSHRTLSKVWETAAKLLSEAENIFVVGYSLPPGDGFFEYLYALGTVGSTLLERLWVFNPDSTGEVNSRFQKLIGAGAKQSYRFFPLTFEQAIGVIHEEVSA